jgi:hypothetical protein
MSRDSHFDVERYRATGCGEKADGITKRSANQHQISLVAAFRRNPAGVPYFGGSRLAEAVAVF